MTNIFLAEDDENLGSLLKEYLKAKNYQTDWFINGDEAIKNFVAYQYDICILDVMMPIKDGFTLAKEIRMQDEQVPVLFLTAKSMKDDVLEGFSLGADDYVTKPFSMEELLYRIEAILRRTKTSQKSTEQYQFQLGTYTFDAHKQLLVTGNQEQKLTTKESELLKLLCLSKNQILERNYALNAIWSDDSYFNARSMDVYITKLRKYLRQDPSIQILNIHGKGFRLIDG
jgi:DNA-binding response OmpR family regulator